MVVLGPPGALLLAVVAVVNDVVPEGLGDVLAEALVGVVVVVLVSAAGGSGDGCVPPPPDLARTGFLDDLDPDPTVLFRLGHHEGRLDVDPGTLPGVLRDDVVGPVGRPVRHAGRLLLRRRKEPRDAVGDARQVLDLRRSVRSAVGVAGGPWFLRLFC